MLGIVRGARGAFWRFGNRRLSRGPKAHVESIADIFFSARSELNSKVAMAAVALLGGCTASSSAPQAEPLPPPSDFQICGSIEINLTPQEAIETGLPSALKATLEATAHAEAVSR